MPDITYNEEHVIAGLLEKPGLIRTVRQILPLEEIYFQNNHIVYEALLELGSYQEFNGNPLDYNLLKQTLETNSKFDETIETHLRNLKQNIDAPKDLIAVTRLVHKQHQNECREREIGKLRGALQSQDLRTELKIELIQVSAQKLTYTDHYNGSYNLKTDANDLLQRARNRQQGLFTGFHTIDAMTRGLHSGEITIVASRPSMGKSAFVTNIASNMVFQGKKVMFFSLEMSPEQVFERLLASITNLTLEQLHSGDLNQDQKDVIAEAVTLYQEQDFVLECPTKCSLSYIRDKYQHECLSRKPDVIIIDYLQLMKPDTPHAKREREVASMSWETLQFAKEEQIPILLVCQLNRDNEKLKVRKPMLSDLRESGSLEQDAHNVMFIHREDYYREREGNGTLDHKAECIVAKNRQGPVGVAQMSFQGRYFLFRDFI